MTRKEAIEVLQASSIKQMSFTKIIVDGKFLSVKVALDMAIDALERVSINKSDMMWDIYMAGVNMDGEYQGCWVRFKEIEKIINKYMAESEEPI